jgi:uncharacterized protein YbjT (DUF2867 family)
MSLDKDELFCNELHTIPRPEIGKILVTGATGYVGGHLVQVLLSRGYRIRIATRGSVESCITRWPEVETIVADALDLKQMLEALKGIHTAYYLIHSLLLGPREFEKADIQAAINFRKAAEINNVKRIIYLGALGDIQSSLSPHLRTRLQVAKELQIGKIQTTILRAAIIIGSGSASYEILKNLIKKSPIFLIPYWAKTKCQPISIGSLINILVGILETDGTSGRSYDIGGNEILTYEKMLKTFSKILNKRKLFIRSSFSNVKFYSYYANLLTPIPAPIIRSLLESCRNEVICKEEDSLLKSLYQPIEFKEAILRTLTQKELDTLPTSTN